MKLHEMETAELLAVKKEIEEILASRQNPGLCWDIKLETEGGKVYTTSPYNSEFVTKARNLRGEWQSGRWAFSTSVLEHVRNVMLECYGVTGENPYETVTLLVKEWNDCMYIGGLELFGRPIAKAYGRDSGAKLQDGIVLLEGRLTSGGSVKNWQTAAKDATFEIHNFPKVALSRADVQTALSEGWVEVK